MTARRLFTELLLTILVASALIVPFIAFETVAEGSSLQIHFRWVDALIGIAVIVIGRMAVLTIWPAIKKTVSLPSLIKPFGAKHSDRISDYIFILLIVFAILLPFMPFADRRILDVGILLLTYIMLGWGLSLVVGIAGLLDLGYIASYAIGAYTFALLNLYFDFSFWMCLPLAGIVAALVALFVGGPVLRLRGDYFAIVTLGLAEIVRIVLINWQSLTKGPDGISGIARPSFFGIAEFTASPDVNGLPAFHEMMGLEYSPLQRIIFLYYIIFVLALLTGWLVSRLVKLPLGRAFEALRENEIAAQSLGINYHSIKMAAYGLSAFIGGLAGAFFATRQGFISPESFNIMESIIILAIVVLGGSGHRLGAVIATVILIGLPELFRDLEQYRLVAFGAGLILIMIWRPQGMLSERKPTILLPERVS